MLNGYKSYIGLGLYALGYLLGFWLDPETSEIIKEAGLLIYGGGMAHKLAKAGKNG